jgi:phage gp37-like protein
MFEFLFKRTGDKPGDPPAAQPDQASAPAGSQRAVQAEKLRQTNGDEVAAVEFILQSEFSELRLAAAEFVHTLPQLERVHTAMRNTDRRVAKLVHGRIEALRHHEAELQRGRAAIEQANALLRDSLLTPNHVAELDRRWSVINAPELAAEFDAVRAQLGQRLEEQVRLQRAMIDRVASLRKLETSGLTAAELSDRLAQLAQEQQAALAAPEHATLPRSLVAEFGAEHARLLGSLADIEAGQAALAAREAALAEWQAAAPAALDADTLRKAWQKLPPLPGGAAGALLQRRFDELLASLPQEPRKPKEAAPKAERPAAAPKAPPRGADQAFLDALDAMEAALQQGSLGTAAELDKVLKESKADGKGMRLTAAQADRLAHVRGELKRLSDWARWGGNVSREELVKSVEALPTLQLSMSELAKKVGSMRERWKALDSLSGPAPKSLWERFDAACTAAYAPAAAHFRQLADERHANAARGQELIAEATAEIASIDIGEADWKHVASTVQRLRTAWSHLGAIDRKEKKRLDHQFSDALNTLQAPLEEQRKVEMARREELIDQVAALDPHERHVLDEMRTIQHHWQEQARALPLERRVEQALWQRFRAACDFVFASRKESAHAADAERRAHESAKEAICSRLEAAAPDATPATAGKLLREAAAEWHAAGPVPRAHEARVEKRYHDAVALVQHHADTVRRAAGLAQAGAVRDQLRLVQALEEELADPAAQGSADDWNARWDALPAANADYERALRPRFDAALAALTNGRDAYARLLEQNRTTLLHELLRLEIAAGIDSGPEFARERLKLQVEVLQSSLKSGKKPATNATELRQLCALPALADARTASRIEHLLMRLAKEGK